MARYQFVLGTSGEVRKAGIIDSETFSAALEAINENVPVSLGDTLEIGVSGFPPARFSWLLTADEPIPAWRPARAAA